MIQAFGQLGYQVTLVTGRSADRKRAVRRVRKDIRMGQGFDFVYSESSTLPTLLTDRHHLPSHPFLDFGFLQWIRKRSVPIGLFYRDIYWKFDLYRLRVPWYKRSVAMAFFQYDWMQYVRLVDHLFLPSLSMRKVLPGKWPDAQVSALPPGCWCGPSRLAPALPASSGLEIFYVGGVTPPNYDLRPMLETVSNLQNVRLTLCCPDSEWERVRGYYAASQNGNTRIVHGSGPDLEKYYSAADVFLIIRNPHPYLDFQMPVKLFESLGHGLPVIAEAGTEAGRFVAREGIGWAVTSQDELRDLLGFLNDHPGAIAEKRRSTEEVRRRHTWRVRAETVAGILNRRNGGT